MIDPKHNSEFLGVAMWSLSLAMMFQLINAGVTFWNRPVSKKQFLGGLLSAGVIGVIVGLLTEGFGLNRWFSDVIIAVCGYIGSPLLEIVRKEVPELLGALFDGAQSKISSGKGIPSMKKKEAGEYADSGSEDD